jgi:hypothetical protein
VLNKLSIEIVLTRFEAECCASNHCDVEKATVGWFEGQASSSSSSSSSSSVGGAGGNPAYRTSAFEAVCTFNPVLVPHPSPEALHTIQRERSLLAKGGSMGEKWPVKFCQTIRLPRNCWVL